MEPCEICPRLCRVDRVSRMGFCRAGEVPSVARAALHFWEEPPISGTRGSGAVFFSGCNLRCVFCQNGEISAHIKGAPKNAEELAQIYLRLESQGAHNINLVTPTPHSLVVADSMERARAKGLKIPFVWNSSAYERVETLRCLEGLVDIYLPDLKYSSDLLAKKYSAAPDYCSIAEAALKEMWRQCGPLLVDGGGVAVKGVLVRHLLLPRGVENARRVVDALAGWFGGGEKGVALSLMRQYTPMHLVLSEPQKFAAIARRVTPLEYDRAAQYAMDAGISQLWLQGKEAASSEFTPPFNGEGT